MTRETPLSHLSPRSRISLRGRNMSQSQTSVEAAEEVDGDQLEIRRNGPKIKGKNQA